VKVKDFKIGMAYLHFGGMIIFLQPQIVKELSPNPPRASRGYHRRI
jgi:hypothetical protein